MGEFVYLEVADGIGTIRLNRPKVNALNDQVTAELDYGPILEQAVVPVLAGDTAATLAARVLTQEHLIYPRAIARLLPSL